MSQRSYQLNRKHVVLKKQARRYELRSDLIDTEIAVCSKGLMQHLTEDFQMSSLKEDFTINLITNELSDDQIMAYILPKNAYFGRVMNPRTYQVISRDIVLRKASPFTVDYPVFTGNDYKVMPFNKYVGVNCKRHASSAVEDVNVIGKEVLIGQNTRIVNSVIGDGCTIGNNVVIKNCIVWSNVQI